MFLQVEENKGDGEACWGMGHYWYLVINGVRMCTSVGGGVDLAHVSRIMVGLQGTIYIERQIPLCY